MRATGLALASALAAACDENEPQTFGERRFLSESVEGRELVPGTRISMWFIDDRYALSAGCNAIDVEPYALRGGRLEADWFSITEKGCGAGLHEQDDWLRAFLETDPAYSLVEPRLTLSHDNVTIVLIDREVAEPDLPLQGQTWRVTGLRDGGLVRAGDWSAAHLSFSDSGTLSIVTPCSPGAGTFDVVGSTISLRDMDIAPNACPDEEFTVILHDYLSRVLADGEVEHRIDANQLTIERGDIGLYLSAD